MPTEDAVRAVPPGNGEVRIYHNPRCSKSRATLALLRDRGLDPLVVDYLSDPPAEDTIRQLLSLLGLAPRELMRRNEPEYAEHELDDPSLDEDELIAAMHRHPKLIERPIVVANGAARIGRPPESVLDIL